MFGSNGESIVGLCVGDSVVISRRGSVGEPVGFSDGKSVGSSVGNDVGTSVGDWLGVHSSAIRRCVEIGNKLQ